jgi:hypothetical protein
MNKFLTNMRVRWFFLFIIKHDYNALGIKKKLSYVTLILLLKQNGFLFNIIKI